MIILGTSIMQVYISLVMIFIILKENYMIISVLIQRIALNI